MKNNMNIMQLNDELLIAAAGGDHTKVTFEDDKFRVDMNDEKIRVGFGAFGHEFGFYIPLPW